MTPHRDEALPDPQPETQLNGWPLQHRIRRSGTNWSWPGGQRLAVWVIPNIEVVDPTYSIEPGRPAPDFRGYALREFGNQFGFERISGALVEWDIPATAAVNAEVAFRHPHLIEACLKFGWEIMAHGLVNNRQMTDYPGGQEAAAIKRTLAVLEEASGARPRGWLGPGLGQTDETIALLAYEGIAYFADWPEDEQPYTVEVAGSNLISLPYSLETNDKSAYDRRLLSPPEFTAMAIRQFDRLLQDSTESPRVFALALHPYLSGQPHRIGAVEAILEHLGRHRDDIWLARGSEIARHFEQFATQG